VKIIIGGEQYVQVVDCALLVVGIANVLVGQWLYGDGEDVRVSECLVLSDVDLGLVIVFGYQHLLGFLWIGLQLYSSWVVCQRDDPDKLTFGPGFVV
jgi:hypothetical protein